MSSFNFGIISKLFGGEEISSEKQDELFEEVLVLALARMARADSSVDSGELVTVRKVIKAETGKDVSDSEIRVAASSELYEMVALDKYLSRIAKQLDAEHRVRIVRGLSEVIRSDAKVTDSETDFFDLIATALGTSPSELAGLKP